MNYSINHLREKDEDARQKLHNWSLSLLNNLPRAVRHTQHLKVKKMEKKAADACWKLEDKGTNEVGTNSEPT